MNTQNGPWKITSSEVKYQNPWISVREDQVVQLNGKPGIFGIVTMVSGSTVLALDKAGNVYLTKEYKYAVRRDSVEIISGAIDEGETPLEAAKRELREEAGLTAAKWTDLGVVDPFTTVINCPNHLFLAEDLTEGERELDHNEVIEITKVPFEKAFDMVMKGEITHGASVVLILKAHALRASRRLDMRQ